MIDYYKKYSILQILSLIVNTIFNKIFISRKIRIIRFPYSLIGKQLIVFSAGFSAGKRLRIECLGDNNKKLFFGKNIKLNDDVHIGCIEKIVIEDNVLIGSKVLIIDHQHGKYTGEDQDSPYSTPDERKLFSKPILIEKNVWIGEMVSVMPGITIGSGSIIGSNSVITKDIPKNSIAVGNPCKVIKKYNDILHIWEKYND